MSRILVLLLLPLLAGILGFSASTSTSAKAAAVQAGHAPSQVNDAQLEATIRAKLAKSKIGKDGFRFKVQHGVVTWEGTTGVTQHKGAATRMARSSGALQVINNIRVTNASKAKTAAPLRKAYVQQ